MSVGTAAAKGLRLLAHHDLAGSGDGMQVMREGDALYVGHSGTSRMGTSILDVADPLRPRLVDQWPAPDNTHTHKVQVAGGLLLVNHERFPYRPTGPLGPHSAGLAVYDLKDPFAPEQIAFWESGGKGVHRIVWEGGRYAHMSAVPDGFRDRIWVAVDLSDPARPVEAGRWWWPGQWEAGGERPDWPAGRRYAAHHALTSGDVAYLGFDDANLVVLDVSDMASPKMIGRCQWGGGATHTCLPLPGRDLLVVTDEQQHDGPSAPERRIHLVDVADPAEPSYRGAVPHPEGPYDDLPMRFGPHNLHENRQGSYRSERLIFATYFNAGVRVYDLEDPDEPREIAHWVSETPPGQQAPQANDLFVDEGGLIWVTDRTHGGLFVLEPEPALAALMEEARA
ncbi:LVIVD repeat-containing protein [Planotetraspora mira]|uniref:LVIVD repeat-containing protein n=1 Tax=Planotetraspora mira TaxID=58121 RepID=A0A8J3X6V6_9ACTN|nr:hypothetical protein [Planotetraspora mira]GII29224.1 hypothetical protein Pmi06nite_26660 [Planotetraspora mira]